MLATGPGDASDGVSVGATPAGVNTSNQGVSSIVVNPTGDQASLIAYDDGSIVQIDVENAVTFSGTANNLAGQERQVFNSTLLATFVALLAIRLLRIILAVRRAAKAREAIDLHVACPRRSRPSSTWQFPPE